MAVARLALTSFADGELRLSDEVELYQRTYTTLLRSSGETQLRVLEPSHMAMGSSLHPLAASEELDLGAFLYAVQRLPDGIAGAELVVMGQDVEALTAAACPSTPGRRPRPPPAGDGGTTTAPARSPCCSRAPPTSTTSCRRSWRSRSSGTRSACECAPPGGRTRLARPDVAAGGAVRASSAAAPTTGRRLRRAWGDRFGERMRLIGERRLSLRVRMLGGTHTGYARLTRRWWAPVAAELAGEGLTERPLYFVSSNSHSLVNIVTGIAHELEPELIAFVEQLDEDDILRQELDGVPRRARAEGSWENFLYFVARLYFSARGPRAPRRAPRRRAGKRRHPPAQQDRAARAGAGDLAGRARPRRRSTRGSARSTAMRSPRAAR